MDALGTDFGMEDEHAVGIAATISLELIMSVKSPIVNLKNSYVTPDPGPCDLTTD
jgi:hypothetical protein